LALEDEDEDGRTMVGCLGRGVRRRCSSKWPRPWQLTISTPPSREPESLLMLSLDLLPPPFLACSELSLVQIPFPQLLTPSKAPPSFLLFLSFLTHSFTFQTIGVPDTQESGASGGFMAGLTKVGSHQGWADSHGSRVHKYAICKAAYLMHR